MLHATFARLSEEDVEPLRAWLGGLRARREELAESYRHSGTTHELFFLVRGDDGPILVLISELRDRERSGASFLRSELPIDVEFKDLVQEHTLGPARVEMLYDSRVTLGEGTV